MVLGCWHAGGHGRWQKAAHEIGAMDIFAHAKKTGRTALQGKGSRLGQPAPGSDAADESGAPPLWGDGVAERCCLGRGGGLWPWRPPAALRSSLRTGYPGNTSQIKAGLG